MNKDVQALVDLVSQEKTVEQSAIVLMTSYFNSVQEGIDNDDLAAIQQVNKDFQNNLDTLSKAVVANTPAAPASGGGTPPPPVKTPLSFTDNAGDTLVVQSSDPNTPQAGDAATVNGQPLSGATANTGFTLSNGATLVLDPSSNVVSYTPAA